MAKIGNKNDNNVKSVNNVTAKNVSRKGQKGHGKNWTKGVKGKGEVWSDWCEGVTIV